MELEILSFNHVIPKNKFDNFRYSFSFTPRELEQVKGHYRDLERIFDEVWLTQDVKKELSGTASDSDFSQGFTYISPSQHFAYSTLMCRMRMRREEVIGIHINADHRDEDEERLFRIYDSIMQKVQKDSISLSEEALSARKKILYLRENTVQTYQHFLPVSIM